METEVLHQISSMGLRHTTSVHCGCQLYGCITSLSVLRSEERSYHHEGYDPFQGQLTFNDCLIKEVQNPIILPQFEATL